MAMYRSNAIVVRLNVEIANNEKRKTLGHQRRHMNSDKAMDTVITTSTSLEHESLEEFMGTMTVYVVPAVIWSWKICVSPNRMRKHEVQRSTMAWWKMNRLTWKENKKVLKKNYSRNFHHNNIIITALRIDVESSLIPADLNLCKDSGFLRIVHDIGLFEIMTDTIKKFFFFFFFFFSVFI